MRYFSTNAISQKLKVDKASVVPQPEVFRGTVNNLGLHCFDRTVGMLINTKGSRRLKLCLRWCEVFQMSFAVDQRSLQSIPCMPQFCIVGSVPYYISG